DGHAAQAARRMAGQAARTQAGQAAGRAAGDDHRRGLGNRAEPGSAAIWSWLGRGHRRHRRGRAEGDPEDAAGAGAGPGARRPGRGGRGGRRVRAGGDRGRFAAEVLQWLPSLPGSPPLAAVFNNAGVAVASSVLDADPDDDEWLRQINFGGVVNGTRAFLPILVEQDEGVIVNTSSVFGLLGMPYQSAYCASKFAVRGFTDALRQELRGTGVRAVTVHPGGVRTN